MSNPTRFNSSAAVTDRNPSGFWGTCPWDSIQNGSVDGTTLWDDFTTGGLITSPTIEAALIGIPWSGFGSSGATITHGVARGGTIIMTEATDNEACYLRSATTPFQISANLGKLWFEARVKVNAITDNQIGFIIGLMDSTAATVVVPLSTADPPVLSACNFVGFRGPEEDAGAVHSCYIADGVTPVEVQSTVHQFVADTYVKLGMIFDPNDSNKLAFYVNGLKQSSTKTIPDATGTDFPADVTLGFVCGHRLGANTSSLTTLDWVRVAQLGV